MIQAVANTFGSWNFKGEARHTSTYSLTGIQEVTTMLRDSFAFASVLSGIVLLVLVIRSILLLALERRDSVNLEERDFTP